MYSRETNLRRKGRLRREGWKTQVSTGRIEGERRSWVGRVHGGIDGL